MFVSFASEGGIKDALAQTFDGKRPCKICKFVREGKEAEKKSPKQEIEKKKLDPMIAQSSSVRVEPVSFSRPEHGDIECVLRVRTPLGEPPDFA